MKRKRQGRVRAIAVRIALSFILAAFGLALTAPNVVAVTADDVNAVINGSAVGWGAYVPADVSPLVELYPVYSSSVVTKDSSHGISAGFYPGFLVDAAAEFYGYGGEARSTMGVAESLWPNPPQRAVAATSDFGDKCRFMGTNFGFPPSFVTFCSRNWYEYDENLPYEMGSGNTYSDELVSLGLARGTRIRLAEGITAGAVEVNTSTSARDGKTVVSETTVLMDDVVVDAIKLRIKQLRTHALASSNGKASAAKHTRDIQLNGVTLNGEDVKIDEAGIYEIEKDGTYKDLNKQLADQGFAIRLVQGATTVKGSTTSSESGSILLTWTGSGEPQPLHEPNEAACDQLAAARAAQEQQFKALTGDEYLYEVDASQPNPLKDESNPLYPYYARDKRPIDVLPDSVEVQQPVPPIVPCAVTAMQRNVRTGIALGDSYAEARFQPIPAPPDFDFGGGPAPSLPPLPDDPALPPSNPEVPSVDTPHQPPPVMALVPVDYLGSGIGGRVKLIYGGFASVVLLLLIGRGTFKNLIRL